MPKKRPYPIHENLKKLRHWHNKMTQGDMAKFLGISGMNYTQKENGYLEFKIDEAKKMSIFFDIDISYILYREKEIFFTLDVSKRKQEGGSDYAKDDDSQASGI